MKKHFANCGKNSTYISQNIRSQISEARDSLIKPWTYYLMDLAYQPKNGHSCCVASWENDVTLMSLIGC